MLSECQENALNLIKDWKSIFLTGSAGNGKSFLIKQLKNLLPGKTIILTATTGVSAFNLGGRTIHSFCHAYAFRKRRRGRTFLGTFHYG